ncbi:MAG: calcium-binding protein [Actinomycetota bacterium]|nr:calcium-binding protein [Actinomycetota bacterium]
MAGTAVFAPATGVAIAPDTTVRASVASDGTQANGESSHPDISEDGRYIAFWSWASTLVPEDANGWGDIFLRDTESNETTCVSVDLDGDPASHGATNDCEISGSGRYVAFSSDSPGIVAGDTGADWDLFVRDMQSNETTLASQSTAGVKGNDYSNNASLSADGRYVAFFSNANNLVPGDTNGRQDVFVRDLQLGVTTRVSVGPASEQGNGHSFYPKISKDGTKVAFITYATTFAADDTSSQADIYIKTLAGGAIERVNVKPDGGESSAEVALSDYMGLSDDGRYVAFASRAGDLVSTPVQSGSCIYVRDVESDVTTAPVHAADGGLPDSYADFPSMTGDGSLVAFLSGATNLVADDTNSAQDAFVVDVATGECVRASVDSSGQEANNITTEGRIAGNGTALAFLSRATNLVPSDTNSQPDVFVRSLVTAPADTTAPTVMTNAVARYTGMAHISITATDGPDGSGVASVSYDLDSGGDHHHDGDLGHCRDRSGHASSRLLGRGRRGQ